METCFKIQGKKEIGKREILAGRRGRNVSTATELNTSLEDVGSQGEKLVLEESRKKKSNPFYRNKVFNEDDGILLEKLEGVIETQEEYLEELELEGELVGDNDLGVQVKGNLFNHRNAWTEMGAGKMVQNIITEGLKLYLVTGCPGKYKEQNNKNLVKILSLLWKK